MSVIKKFLIIKSIMFVLVSYAGAYEMPTGQLCATNNPSLCFTPMATDDVVHSVYTPPVTSGTTSGFWHPQTNTYRMTLGDCYYKHKSMDLWRSVGSPAGYRDCVFVGTSYPTWLIKRYLFPDIPVDDKNIIPPQEYWQVMQTYVGTQLISTINGRNPQFIPGSAVDYSRHLQVYCDYYAVKVDGYTKDYKTALDRTPDSVFTACKFLYRQSTKPVTTTTNTGSTTNGGTTTTPVKPDPNKLKNCKRIRIDDEYYKLETKTISCIRARKLARKLYDDPDNTMFELEETDESYTWTHKNNKIIIKLTILD